MTDHPRPSRFARFLARAYPRELRDEYAEDLARFIDDTRHDARYNNSTFGRISIAGRLVGDALVSKIAAFRDGAPRPIRKIATDALRDRVGLLTLDSIAQDLRVAVRSLGKRPGFTVAVIVTLALGIGANSAVFSLLDAVVLNPLPVGHADRLVSVFEASNNAEYDLNSFGNYAVAKRNARTFSGLAASLSTVLPLSQSTTDEVLAVGLVSENYFELLELSPKIGNFIATHTPPGAGIDASIVLSTALWKSHFASDAAIVGKSVELNKIQFTVVGVAPDRFHGTDLGKPVEAWVPMSMGSALQIGMVTQYHVLEDNSHIQAVSIVGRLATGVTSAQASADLNRLASATRGDDRRNGVPPTGKGSHAISVLSINEVAATANDRENLVRYLRLIAAVVAVTLLLTCVNVANLLIVRGRERSTELGIRAALGAGASRLARQLLTETMVLAAAGGALGLVVATVAIKLASAFALPGGVVLKTLNLGIDTRVLAFTAALSLLTAFMFGLLPAIHAARRSISERIRRNDSTRRTAIAGRATLLALQIAISLTLVVGAGLFLRSIQRGMSTSIGFDARKLAAISIYPDLDGSYETRAQRYLDIVANTARTPGILSVAAARHVPLAPLQLQPMHDAVLSASATDQAPIMMPVTSISDDYFKTLQVPIVEGRTFGAQDGANGARVTILNESAAHALWPGQSAIGKKIQWMDLLTYTVVGVVRDIKYTTLQEHDVPVAYAPLLQEDTRGSVALIARSDRPADALAALQRNVHELAPMLHVRNPRLVIDQVNQALLPQRFGATLLSMFALLALCLSAVGIYGSVAYTVARRTREIGIRLALGASRIDVMLTVGTDVLVALGAGLALGAAGTAVGSTVVVHMLYGVSATDWIAFGSAVLTVITVAFAAALIPARRATRVDPVQAIQLS